MKVGLIHADASVYAGLFDGDESATLTLDPARRAYVHVVRGTIEVNGQSLRDGDALMLEQEGSIALLVGARPKCSCSTCLIAFETRRRDPHATPRHKTFSR